MSTQSSAAGRL
jgi:hypothetical protein